MGDGAGVGKGRTVAGVIFENFLKGRTKAIWVSISNDLKYDAERDLKVASTVHFFILIAYIYLPIMAHIHMFHIFRLILFF